MKTWECTECGYLHEGHKPPRRCPDCDAPSSVFELVEEDLDEWDEDWGDDDLEEDWDDDWAEYEDDDEDDIDRLGHHAILNGHHGGRSFIRYR